MKKIFLFLAVASASMFVSCSDDDSNGPAVDPNAATSIVLAANVNAIEVGESVILTVTDNNAQVVTSNSAILVNDVAISGSTFTPDVAGTFTVKATYTNTNNVVLTSNSLTITVAEPVNIEPNSIFVNDTNYAVNTSVLVFFGGYAADPDATVATHGLWSYIMTDDTTGNVISNPASANNYIDVEMIVPIVDGSAPFPTPANASFLDIYEIHVAGEEVVLTSQEGGSMVLSEFPSAVNMPHAFSATANYNAGSSLAADFNGNWLGFIDATAARPAFVAKGAQSFSVKKVMTKAEVLKKKAAFMASLNK